MCDYICDIQGWNEEEINTYTWTSRTQNSPQINVENSALQNRKLHYGINRILELCVLELCEHLCSIFISHLSLLVVKLCTLFKLFIIPVSSFRNKVLIYSRIILYTCQASPTTRYHLVIFQHCKIKSYIVI